MYDGEQQFSFFTHLITAANFMHLRIHGYVSHGSIIIPTCTVIILIFNDPISENRMQIGHD